MGADLSHYPSLLSEVNSSTAALNSGNSYTFTGQYQECSKASHLILEYSCNGPVDFTIRWSEDSAGATSYEEDAVVTGTQTVVGSAYNSVFLPISPIKGKHFRIKANSGATTISFFICRVRLIYQGSPFAVDSDGKLITNTTGGSGGDGAILDGVSSSIKATVLDLTSSNPLTAAIVDATGAQITSFGGGVQYTEGDTDASITGTAVMWEDTADTLRAVSAAKPLPVGDAGGSLTVDAVNLDIRDLSSASDSVSVLQATASNLNAQVVGEIAHDAADSGNPIKIGGKALSSENPTSVTANDRVNTHFDQKGRAGVMLAGFNDTSIVDAEDDSQASPSHGINNLPLLKRGGLTTSLDAVLFNDGTSGGVNAGTRSNGTAISTERGSYVEVEISLVSAGTGTQTFQVIFQSSADGTNYADYDSGWEQNIRFEDTEVTSTKLFVVRCPSRGIKFRTAGLSAGTTSSLTFTCTTKIREVTTA